MTDKGTVLVVDDTVAALRLLSDMLTQDGYQVRPADSGELALASVAASPPELILLDIRMPGLDGFEVCRALKGREETREIPVLFISAHTDVEDRVKGWQLGAVDFISKPLRREVLLARVDTHLQLSRLRARLKHRAAELESANRRLETELAERLRAQEALRQSEEHLSTTLHSIGDAVIATDASCRVERMNPVAEALTGWSLAEAKGKPVAEVFRIVNESTRAPVENPAERVLRDGAVVGLANHTALIARDGAERPIKDSGAPIRAADGSVNGVVLVFRDATEEKRANEALAYRAGLVDAVGDPVVATDADYVVRSWNPGAERMYGWLESEVVGKPLGDTLHIEYQGVSRVEFLRRLEATTRGQVELRCRNRAGRPIDVEASVVALTDEAGKRSGFVAVHRNVTERNRLGAVREATAAVNAALLAPASSIPTIAAAILDQARRLTDSPHGFVSSCDAATGELTQEAVTAPAFAKAGAWSLAMSGGTLDRYGPELAAGRPLLSNAARELPAVKALPPTHLPIDKVLGVPAVIGTETVGVLVVFNAARDYSDDDFKSLRALADLFALGIQRKRAELAQRDSERRFRTLTQSSPAGIVQTDARGDCVFASTRWCELTGLTDQQAEGRGWVQSLDPEDRERVTAEWYGSIRDGRPFEAEYRLRRPDGKVHWVLGVGTAVRNADGAVAGYLRSVTDLTEHKKLQARLLLADRMVSVGTLAAGVAHEINNPLAYVLSNIRFAADELAAARVECARHSPAGTDLSRIDEALAALTEAREGGERVRNIVRDLKTFSRTEDSHLSQVDVERVLESSINMTGNEIRHRAQLVRDYGVVPAVECNESRLGQVFLNLLVNAAQAIPEGHASSNEIRVSTRVDSAGRVQIEISDTGSGIPAEHLSRIFDPFFTTKPVGVGTGLGLAICHGIVTGLGGELSVESTLGKGTTFRVALPAASAQAKADPAPEPEVRVRPGRILVVDDEPLVGKALKRVLGPKHDVVLATSAKQGLEHVAHGERFDVILCDVMMPEMTGMELHAELLRVAPELAARVVFVTGGTFTEQAREFLDRVPNGRLEKPIDPGELARALFALLGPPG